MNQYVTFSQKLPLTLFERNVLDSTACYEVVQPDCTGRIIQLHKAARWATEKKAYFTAKNSDTGLEFHPDRQTESPVSEMV